MKRVMQTPQPPEDFQTQVLTELRSINTRLSTLETKVDRLEGDVKTLKVELTAYQKGLDGMVRMATTIVITAGAAVIFAPLIKEIAPAIASLIKP
jgi:hypothetical protein